MVGEFILQVLVLKISRCTRRLLKKKLIIPPVCSEATAVRRQGPDEYECLHISYSFNPIELKLCRCNTLALTTANKIFFFGNCF